MSGTSATKKVSPATVQLRFVHALLTAAIGRRPQAQKDSAS
jgi:hypothetical protein